MLVPQPVTVESKFGLEHVQEEDALEVAPIQGRAKMQIALGYGPPGPAGRHVHSSAG